MAYLQMPCPGELTDAFGIRDAVYDASGNLVVSAQHHTGRDIAADAGTPIHPAAPGTVTRKWWDEFIGGGGAGGWMIEIDHGNGIVTRYAHMMYDSNKSVGDWVTLDSVIGLVGATGAATGPHLHFELLVNGAYVDPDFYLHPRTGTPKPIPTPVAVTAPAIVWEDTLKQFKGESTRTKNQTLKGGVQEYVTFRDDHDDDKWGDRTIARGPGAIVGLNADVRLKGKPGTRVQLELVVETGQNKNRVVIAEPRGVVDSLGLLSLQIGASVYLKEGQLVRLLAQPEKGQALVVEKFYWRGFARPGV